MPRQVVLDTETTGLELDEGHRIIEIGCVELWGRRRSGQTFHKYLNPERTIPNESTKIHGITDDHVAGCPSFPELADSLLAFLDGSELIIHNAPFDVGFLNMELTRVGYPQIEAYCSIRDTLQEARRLHPGQKNDLDSLCQRYSVDNQARDKHGALLDAELLADIYLALTGGQADLQLAVDEILTARESDQGPIDTQGDQRPSLPVIEPGAEEWAAHRQFLERIQEESGDCQWLAQEEGGAEHLRISPRT